MAQLEYTVGPGDTALALGSGDVDVLATPRLLAWLEAATVTAAGPWLEPGQTSVGTRVELEHLAPCAVGTAVTVTADLSHHDGRLMRFTVAAAAPDGTLVAAGTLTRVVVDRERFEQRSAPRG